MSLSDDLHSDPLLRGVPIREGHKVLGPCVLTAKLGGGGPGVVYRGRHFALDIDVTVRCFGVTESAGLVSHLSREAQAAARITSRNLVRVYDVSEASGLLYVITEHVDGETVRERVERRSALEPNEAVAIALDAARGLAAAHGVGIAHFDVNPDAIIVSRTGVVKLDALGFGAALAAAGIRFGTPAYLSPERFVGSTKKAPAQDVWALGAVLFFMLTGRDCVDGGTTQEVASRIMNGGFPSLGDVRPDLPRELDAMIAHCMKLDPAERPATAAELAEEMTALLTRSPSSTAKPGSGWKTDFKLTPWFKSEDAILLDPDGKLVMATPGEDVAEPIDPTKDEVQFTVYRPRSIAPDVWETLLVFAHMVDGPPDGPHPLQEVVERAARTLGKEALEDYRHTTEEGAQPVPRDSELSFVPVVDGVRFNPPARTFLWTEPVHEESFRMCAVGAVEGRTLRGSLSVYMGVVLLADINLRFEVGAGSESPDRQPVSSRPYRKVFASYSHRDTEVVRQCERYARLMGDLYLRDVSALRSGEVWSDRLCSLIEEADVFQLFWSTSAMESAYVRREWEHALALGREGFIRPTYWETPLPRRPDAGLPPPELQRLHFQRLEFDTSEDTPDDELLFDEEVEDLELDDGEIGMATAPISSDETFVEEETVRRDREPDRDRTDDLCTMIRRSREEDTGAGVLLSAERAAGGMRSPLSMLLWIIPVLLLIALAIWWIVS